MGEPFAQPQTHGFTELAPEEASQRPELTVVDARRPDELLGELGHIPGALHLPLELLLHQGPPAHLPADLPLLLVCRSGARSARAAMMLGAWGFSNLHNLTGGMIAWNGALLPVSRRRDDVAPRLDAAAAQR